MVRTQRARRSKEVRLAPHAFGERWDPAIRHVTRVPARLFLLLLNENVKTFVSRIVHAVKARSRAESYLVRVTAPQARRLKRPVDTDVPVLG